MVVHADLNVFCSGRTPGHPALRAVEDGDECRWQAIITDRSKAKNSHCNYGLNGYLLKEKPSHTKHTYSVSSKQ